MGIILILVCTLIGYLCGSAGIGLVVGLVIVILPWVKDEMDKSGARRARTRRRRRR